MQATLKSWGWVALGALVLLLVYQLQVVLGPFLLAALFAYLGDPLADRLQKRNMSRTVAVSLVFMLMTVIMVLSIFILVPLIASQIDLLRVKLPGYIGWLKEFILPYLYSMLGVEQNHELVEKLQVMLTANWQKASDIAVIAIGAVSQSGLAVVGFVSALILVPVLTFYLLRDWDILLSHIQDLLPRRQLPLVQQLAKECDDVLGAFLRGQLLIMICLGLIYSLGLMMLGVDLALLVGLVAGVASIVPYLGARSTPSVIRPSE